MVSRMEKRAACEPKKGRRGEREKERNKRRNKGMNENGSQDR